MTNNKLQQAMNLFNAGRLAESEALLREIVGFEPNNETAWWWLSAATQDVDWQRHALEQVLAINPSNHEARNTLMELQQDRYADDGSRRAGFVSHQPTITIPAARPEEPASSSPPSSPRRQIRDNNPTRLEDKEAEFYENINEKIEETFGEHTALVKHLVLTGFIAVIMTCICGWYTSPLIANSWRAEAERQSRLTVPDQSNSPQGADENREQPSELDQIFISVGSVVVAWIAYIIPFLIILYFVVGYRLNGTWPHSKPVSRVFNLFLGPKRSFRRHLLLAIIVFSPFAFCTYSGLASGTALTILAERFELGEFVNVTISTVISSFILFVIIFYLLAHVNNWQITYNTAHQLLDSQADKTDRIYDYVLDRMKQRDIPRPYKAEFVAFTERGNFSATEQIETEQLEITYKRARVALRVLEYGTDLYVRWDSYLDLSARRLWLIFGLIASITNGISIRFLGRDLMQFATTLWSILLGRGLKSQGSQVVGLDTILSPAYVDWSFIPSYMIDDLYALEDAVTQSAEEVLNDIRIKAGYSEKMNLSIERSRDTQSRVF